MLVAEATNPSSNVVVDQDGLAQAVGAVPARITSPEQAVAQARAAVSLALADRRTVVLNLSLEVQAQQAQDVAPPDPGGRRTVHFGYEVHA